jgi:hypothetical protein
VWRHLAHDRDNWQALVNSVMNLQFPPNARNLLINCGPSSFSGKTVIHGATSSSVGTIKNRKALRHSPVTNTIDKAMCSGQFNYSWLYNSVKFYFSGTLNTTTFDALEFNILQKFLNWRNMAATRTSKLSALLVTR